MGFAFQNPNTIYDQSLQFSLPCLRPDPKLDILFVTVVVGTVVLNIIYEELFLGGLIENMKK